MSERAPLRTRQRLRQYGTFTPAGIADALALADTLPTPTDPKVRKRLGFLTKNGNFQRTLEMRPAVAWQILKLADARRLTVNRILTEILTYHAVAIKEAELDDGTPLLYADFLSPEGQKVLVQAIKMALRQLGVVGENFTLQDVVDAIEHPTMEYRESPSVKAATEEPAPPLTEAELKELEGW